MHFDAFWNILILYTFGVPNNWKPSKIPDFGMNWNITINSWHIFLKMCAWNIKWANFLKVLWQVTRAACSLQAVCCAPLIYTPSTMSEFRLLQSNSQLDTTQFTSQALVCTVNYPTESNFLIYSRLLKQCENSNTTKILIAIKPNWTKNRSRVALATPARKQVKVKVNIDLYSASLWNLTFNALRCGSHSVNCQSHHTCIYP